LIPLKDAVTVTFCAVVTVPVVAANVALLWLAATVTLAGTVSDPLLLLKVTATALAVALFNDTVQVLDALLPKLEGEHDTDESCAGALAVRVNVCDAPFREAVNSAVWFELTLATLAVNEALLCPDPTATLAGTVILALLLESVTVAPDGAAAFSVTVQLDVPGAFTVAGEQLKLEG
jgi:hypothetical protein